ncbi:MAG: hypothetical protein H7840_13955 [Alphaproteobacteria bacterium]
MATVASKFVKLSNGSFVKLSDISSANSNATYRVFINGRNGILASVQCDDEDSARTELELIFEQMGAAGNKRVA